MERWELGSQSVESVKNVVIIRQMFITKESLNLFSAEEKNNLDSDLESSYSEVMMGAIMR